MKVEVGDRVMAYGHKPPGDGFFIPDGRVVENCCGGYYANTSSVVLVRGPIDTMSVYAHRTRERLECRGVYFHIDDVRRTPRQCEEN
jgi:hypothetical protein